MRAEREASDEEEAPADRPHTAAEFHLAWARKVVAAYEANRGGVLLVEGQLIERPVVRAAQRTLEAAALADVR